MITLIQGLCDDSQPLSQSDINSLIATLKASRLPDELAPSPQVSSLDFTRPLGEHGDEKEAKRLRLDHSCESFLEQLMTPIVDPFKRPHYGDIDKNTVGFVNTAFDSKSALLAKNLFHLQQFGGANVLLDFVMTLPSIVPYIQLVQATEEGAPLKLPTTTTDATSLIKSAKHLIRDFDVMVRVLSLPILEPLTEDRLSKIITTIHAGLYVSVSLVSATAILSVRQNSGTDHGTELEEQLLVADIVDISLDTHRRIMHLMKQSLRVGGQCCQNAHLFASWLLLAGLKYVIGLSPAKSVSTGPGYKTPSSDGASRRQIQGYSTICISLALHAIKTLNCLLEDLKSEAALDPGNSNRLEKLASVTHSGSFKYNKFGCYSAWQRLEMLLSSVNITNLLFGLASVSYRKAGQLRSLRVQQIQAAQSVNAPTPAASSTSSNNIEHVAELISIRTPSAGAHCGAISDLDEECFSCFSSDDSSREDDSEPILGQLFKETDFDRDVDSAKSAGKLTPKSPTFDADRREPQRHLSLALYIFECFNSHFVCSEVEPLRSYFKATLTDAQVTAPVHV